jgi:hypothetical protein
MHIEGLTVHTSGESPCGGCGLWCGGVGGKVYWWVD